MVTRITRTSITNLRGRISETFSILVRIIEEAVREDDVVRGDDVEERDDVKERDLIRDIISIIDETVRTLIVS